jgi:putative FmdB family regulatory protein
LSKDAANLNQRANTRNQANFPRITPRPRIATAGKSAILNGMPLYEYRCTTCDHGFELLMRENTELKCPSCAGTQLEKQLSVFAVGAESPKFGARPAAPAPCGSCGNPGGPGSCSMN